MPLKTKALNKNDTTLKPTFLHQVPSGELTSGWSDPELIHPVAPEQFIS